jgi:glycosyltransferase involved in cell wall biosynthesis
MARIITVYAPNRAVQLTDMSFIRWFRISEALARLGHDVDIATAEFKWRWRKPVISMSDNLRRVPLSRVRWGDYDVVKTLFHRGFQTLQRYGGDGHPFIISKLGSVVAATDRPGIYFYGRRRAELFAVQCEIRARSRYVTVLSEPARMLWEECFGSSHNVLLVPGAADREIPPPSFDPYPDDGRLRCIFSGTFYSDEDQPEANRSLVAKMNALGRRLRDAGARLYVVGNGDPGHLDPQWVTYLGVVPHERAWDYLHFANVGVVLSAGSFMHNNESTKIYHYLRVGLPVVSESGFPNDHVVTESGLGFVVASGNLELMAARIIEAATARWDRDFAISYIVRNHTWDVRARVYDDLLRQHIVA